VLKLSDTLKNKMDSTVYKLIALLNIADTYLWLKNTDEAELYNEAGLTKCSPKNLSWLYYPFLMNKAIIHYQRRQYNDCISLSKQLKDITKVDNNQDLYLTAIFYIGKSSYKLNVYQESLTYLEKALALTNTSDNVNINEKELHEFLALAYNKIGNS